LRSEGLTYHPAGAFRAEMLRALASLYAPEDREAAAARLQTYWQVVDAGTAQDPAEEAAVNDLSLRLTEAWPPLARLGAANLQFVDAAPSVAVAMLCVGWSGLDVPHRRQVHVPLTLIDRVAERLAEIERQAVADKVEGVGAPGTAFAELCSAAMARLNGEPDAKPPRRRKAPVSPPGTRKRRRTSPRTGSAKPAAQKPLTKDS
jgi:hypothetical protein